MTADTTAPFDAGVQSPALSAGEAKTFAEAGLRMLAAGECAQAARLFTRAAAYAKNAA